MRDGGMTVALLDEVRDEVVRLHDFFTGWFSGVLPEDALLNGLRAAHGSNPDFRIEIRDTRLLGDWPDCGLVLAGYVEAQFGARNTTPPDNLRRATVLFERGAKGLIWRHVHETAMPQ
jgi:hypothetical protein